LIFRSSTSRRLRIRKLKNNLSSIWLGLNRRSSGNSRKTSGAKKTRLVSLSWSKCMRTAPKLLERDKCRQMRRNGGCSMRSRLLMKRLLRLRLRWKIRRIVTPLLRRITRPIS
jgi:hypothetical protein